MSLFRVLLAIHLIGVISWMAGILYLIRLFVYHAEETEDVVKERFKLMEMRLYRIITVPAMGLAIVMGLAMILLSPGLLGERWFQCKLVLGISLALITFACGRFVRHFLIGHVYMHPRYFRILNEIPTLIMIVIVLLAILRPSR